MPVPAAFRLTAAMSLALLTQQPALADRSWMDNPCCGYDGRGPQGYRPPPSGYQPNPYRADPYRPNGYYPAPYPQPGYQPAPPHAYPYPSNPYPPHAYPAHPNRPYTDPAYTDPAYTNRPYRPPPVVVLPPVIVAPPQPSATYGRSPAEFVYWCDAPKGYYPNVTTCDGPWREKSATSTR